MARKNSTNFICNNCGAEFLSWSGKCNQCNEWNTLEEQVNIVSTSSGKSGKILTTLNVNSSIAKDFKKIKSGNIEVDNVLGGGFVSGSVNLLAGQPGIGKSTLLLQLANDISKEQNVLYVSGEESTHQIGLRAKRLGAISKNLQLATSTIADDIAETILKGKFSVVVVDSIQTITCNVVASSAGTVSQISNSAALLTSAVKQTATALILVGHVTKEGNIAGPKVLEHAVDVVLQLEGDRYGGFKVLRAVKNRYGSTNESGIFEMSETGLNTVLNPSAALLEERQISDGSIVLATIEGTRPLLVEVQALVNRTSYGFPKRASSGFDLSRLNLLIAMLEKRTKLNLADQDIYINVVGGIRLSEPAADLAIVLAVASAAKGMQLSKNVAVFGEIGLSGELRHVPHIEKRLAEAKKLGFDGAVGPTIKGKQVPKYFGMKDVRTALNTLLSKD